MRASLLVAIAVVLSSPTPAAGQFGKLRDLAKKAKGAVQEAACSVTDKACDATASSGNFDGTVTSVELAAFARSPIVVGPGGTRGGTVVPSGSRTAVLLDGSQGPNFDEVFASQCDAGQYVIKEDEVRPLPLCAPLAIGPGDKRTAYAGRRGGQYFAVLDGTEVPLPGPMVSVGSGDASSKSGSVLFAFSESGDQVAFAAWVGDPAKSGFERPKAQVMVDGTEGPVVEIDPSIFRYVGEKLLFIAHEGRKDYRLYWDLEPTATFDLLLSFQVSDGHWLLAAARDGVPFVVVDGTERPLTGLGPGDRLMAAHLSERGGGWAAVLERESGGGLGSLASYPLIFNGELVASNSMGDLYVTLSPDGKRIAHITKRDLGAPSMRFDDNRGHMLAVNGEVGMEYAEIEGVQFSPDGRRLAYLATATSGLVFVVVDGEEEGGYPRVEDFRFSADGEHYAYVAWNDENERFVVLDGKPGVPMSGIESLTLAPVGGRIAYEGRRSYSEEYVVLDSMGIEGEADELHNLVPRVEPFQFSPDGRRLVFSMNDQLVVDGKVVAAWTTFAAYGPPMFTDDGEHYACAARVGGDTWFVVFDGQVAALDGVPVLEPRLWSFAEDGSLTLPVIREKAVHRVTLTP